MASPNMATLTASLEQSFQKCSLNNSTGESAGGVGIGTSSFTSSNQDEEVSQNHLQSPETTIELNSHISLPYHWEQCLDLKTGEIYYINWSNGMKEKEDPRRKYNNGGNHYYYSEEEEDSSYDSEDSSSESSSLTPPPNTITSSRAENKDHVLVVGGCKSCFMYFMVPKEVQECPKCCGQLLHFDRSQNGSL